MAQLKWQQAGVPPDSGFSLLSLWYVAKSDVYVVIVHLYFFFVCFICICSTLYVVSIIYLLGNEYIFCVCVVQH